MESNGKGVDRWGRPVGYDTGPIVFGEPGTNGQHAFYQLLHQGPQPVPADFIVPLGSHYRLDNHYDILVSNPLPQAEALMRGRTRDAAAAERSDERRVRKEWVSTGKCPRLSTY